MSLNPIHVQALGPWMLRNPVNLNGLVTPKGPKLMNLYDLATSMAPNLITYKVCEGGMERFRTGGPKGLERGRVGRKPQRRGVRREDPRNPQDGTKRERRVGLRERRSATFAAI